MTNWMTEGSTAVITGGASGIGLAAAGRYLERKMNVVIADRNEEALGKAVETLSANQDVSERLASHACDVSKPEDLDHLNKIATERFGPVHCLMNNAGIVNRGGLPWENVDEMRTLVDINLWGIVNGCRAFVPDMLAHGTPGAIINTGSKQGITRPPGNIAYNMSKTAVLAYTEGLAHAFRQIENCKLTAHLLVPGFVYTGMLSAFIPEKPPGAATPEETVDFLLTALKSGDFYVICPDNETTREMDEKRVQWTADDIIKNRPALSRWHADFADEFAAFMKDGDQ